MLIYTIGHSTRPIEEFIDLLNSQSVKQLIDIRTVPRSRHNPQFEQTELQASLRQAGIDYVYISDLGGLRPKSKQSINLGWHNQSFRNYADYMQTDQFAAGLGQLIDLSRQQQSAIMCAEAVPWRCHRSLVADALLLRDITVKEIISKAEPKDHKLTAFAKVDGQRITYPTDQASQ